MFELLIQVQDGFALLGNSEVESMPDAIVSFSREMIKSGEPDIYDAGLRKMILRESRGPAGAKEWVFLRLGEGCFHSHHICSSSNEEAAAEVNNLIREHGNDWVLAACSDMALMASAIPGSSEDEVKKHLASLS